MTANTHACYFDPPDGAQAGNWYEVKDQTLPEGPHHYHVHGDGVRGEGKVYVWLTDEERTQQ